MIEAARQDLFGAIEGYYIVSILDRLHRGGVLAALAAGRSVDEVAGEWGFDAAMLRALVAYVQKRTFGVLPSDPARYAAPDEPSPIIDSEFLGHLLDQYVGAFGPCLADLDHVLADPAAGARRVDWIRHAKAFAGADRGTTNQLPLRLLAQLGINRIVDVGCGSGGFLLDFATQCLSARAWGIDSNSAAVEAGRRAAQVSGLSDRVTFCLGDALDVARRLDPEALETVQVITAFNVANTFFGRDASRDIGSWLSALRQAFPDRFLVLGDYYGRLNVPEDRDSHRFRRALVHDVAQVLTGQGVPPMDIEAWRRILDAAGCTLVKAFEGEHDEVAHFVYLVQL